MRSAVRRLARAEVVEAVAEYVDGLSPETQLVLYGYSSTICDGLARCAPWLQASVFLIEDLQYGVDGSLGEHAHAQKHLERAGIKPILLRFDQIAPFALLPQTLSATLPAMRCRLQGADRSPSCLGARRSA